MPDYTIPNLKNACRILELISRSTEPCTNAEIASKLSIPRTTVLRILAILRSENYVRQIGKCYYLGISLIPLGLSASSQHSLRELCLPILKRVTELTQETCHLATLSQDKALILQVSESPHPMSAQSKQGTLADLYCSAPGKALIANLPDNQLQTLLKELSLRSHTPHTIINKSQLLEELALIKKQGYSVDEEEYHEGVRCLAVPVHSSKTQVKYAIGITASTSRFGKSRIPEVLKILKEAVDELVAVAGLELKADF